jgi:hypothetical protein
VTAQLDLFQEVGVEVEVEKPEPRTTVRLGHRAAQPNLARKRREALKAFIALLEKLEGKDIWISYCSGSRTHFWLDKLKLERLRVGQSWHREEIPGVIVLWGRRDACVRIFTDRVFGLREQDYQGCTTWLLDFWNGFGSSPIDPYRLPGYDSLEVIKFKD